jgi:hypothetical protein
VAPPNVAETETVGVVVPQPEVKAEVTTTTGSNEPPALSPLQQAIASQDTSGPRRFTDEEKTAAVRLVLEEGKTIAEAAEASGASATSVSKWVSAAKNEGGA